MKLIILGSALVLFTALAYAFSLLIEFVNSMIDKSIKKAEVELRAREKQYPDNHYMKED